MTWVMANICGHQGPRSDVEDTFSHAEGGGGGGGVRQRCRVPYVTWASN